MEQILSTLKNQWEKCDNIPIVILFGHGCLVFLYFNYLKWRYHYKDIVHNDALNVKLFTVPLIGYCSWWPITHFYLHFVVTLYRKDPWLVYFFVGILWECFEKLYKVCIDKSSKFSKTRSAVSATNESIEYISWWDSSAKDIVFNSFGSLCGYTVKSLYTNM